ncbi:MAG: hypothetical protein WA810_10645 [Maribacter sp.]
MKGFKTFLLVLLGIMMVFFLALLWYQNKYSMEAVEPYAINSPRFENKLLIATQGSEFKNRVTDKIVSYYSGDSIYISVIDIQGLETIDPKMFKAIVVIHTWENFKPPVTVQTFIDRTKVDNFKIVVITTSGDGDHKMEGVDAITGESIVENVPDFAKEIISRVDPLLVTD